jgi:hypothetical protein
MFTRTTKRMVGAVAAAVTITLVASVAPASAAPSAKSFSSDRTVVQFKDSGWG